MLTLRLAAAVALLLLPACASTPRAHDLAPLPLTLGPEHQLQASRAFGHAHNDYEHPNPLFGALDVGSLSIEADVHLVRGKLLVAHDADEADPARTLQSLYLDPLFERFRAHGGTQPTEPFQGRVRPSGLPLVLMIDFKTHGDTAWPVLESLLATYPGLFRTITTLPGEEPVVTEGPVIVAISGSRPSIGRLINAPIRRTAIDGGLFNDLAEAPAHLYPMVSASDDMALDRSGGQWSPDNTALIDLLTTRAAQATSQGRLSRIWGAPDTPESWSLQQAVGITLINNDDPAALEAHLNR